MAKGCIITPAAIKKGLTEKGIVIAKSVDPAFRISSIGEIVLPLDTTQKYKNEPYKLRTIVDKTITKINKELNIDPRKLGVVFGGVTYIDSAAIQILVTPQINAAYQVKNEEKTIEEILPKRKIPTYTRETAYRPSGFYRGDYALMEQELRDLEEFRNNNSNMPDDDIDDYFLSCKL